MERSRRRVMDALRVALALGFFAASPAAATEREDADARAATRLDAMASALTQATRLRATIDANWDVTQPTGEKVEFGETRVLTVRRPDRLRVEVTRRDGTRRVLLFDGTQLAVSDAAHNVYATEHRPGTFDAALTYLTEALSMRMPLHELLAPDLPATLAPLRQTIRWVGRETIGGVATDHVLLRGDGTDLQVWIASEGDPLPRRIVITYRREEGQPQFRATLLDWHLSPDVPDALFAFTPAEGAEKIPFARPGAAAPRPAQEAAPDRTAR